ncbi:hypothetical protein GGQ97_001737 [Sphingomonas kaistensis]|uniref:DUF3052 domain-containing protein n=1 Tax=Sphingomonas kaistensis TaxID=298708 RepID=A0A7X5Y6G2_9SPHN|nr:hypothetical protein [Sphingomonas kaistensis]NJC05944.1 hypothetical protein [Sphingomonas kaistensis]
MKSLLDKLGYRSGVTALVWRVPDSRAPQLSPVTVGGEPQFLLAFVRDRAALGEAADEVLPSYRRGGHLWLAYPKKSGSILSDLSRDAGWERITRAGLLPVTQVAMDEDWSALRFRFRDEIKKLTRTSAQA